MCARPFLSPLLTLLLLFAIGCVGYKKEADTGDTGTPPPSDPWDDENEPPLEDTGEADDTDDDTDDDTADTGSDCDEETPVVRYLSPDDSNSMSSPVQARETVLAGEDDLSGVTLRTWEFMNYYTFAYDPAPEGELALHAAMVEDETVSNGYRLQIGVSSPAVTESTRPPMTFTFVVDTSGSMNGKGLSAAQESCAAIAASLRARDIVSMVTWNEDQTILLDGHEVDGPSDPEVLEAVYSLTAGGTTNLTAGLAIGYMMADQYESPDSVNRLVLISDGGANTGITDEQMIGQYAGSENEDGIYLVGVGVGSVERYNDLLMDTVTDLGKGASVFIPSEDEAHTMFQDRFMSTMGVAGRDVQVRVDLPPGFRVTRFSGEQMSGDPKEVEPQHIAPDDAMVFHQALQTCAPEILTDDTPVTIEVTWKDATTFEAKSVSGTWTFSELLAQDPALLWKGAAIFAYAEALKLWQVQRDPAVFDTAKITLGWARGYDEDDADLAEIEGVMGVLAP